MVVVGHGESSANAVGVIFTKLLPIRVLAFYITCGLEADKGVCGFLTRVGRSFEHDRFLF